MGSCEGTLMMLDADQSANLFAAINQLELIGLSLTQPQMGFEWGKFRALLETHAPWYDRTNRQMIQACYLNVRVLSACDPSDNAALAIAFFKEDYKWASDVETHKAVPQGLRAL
jgi:hypothetical protein